MALFHGMIAKGLEIILISNPFVYTLRYSKKSVVLFFRAPLITQGFFHQV